MAEHETTWHADLLVIGAGMAGLTAAARAAEQGARVIVVEKGADIGGSAAISGAHLWTVPDLETFAAECPTGDKVLAQRLIDGFPAAVDWVAASGAWMSAPLAVLGYGRGHRIDIGGYLDWCRRTVEKSAGTVLTSRRVDGLIVENRRVTGAREKNRHGTTELRAPWTLLATGGFQGDQSLQDEHIAPQGSLLLRANPTSTGDGLRLARAAGAAYSSHLSAYYGHLVSWPLPRFEPADFVPYTLFYSNLGVLLDVSGRRFVDESRADHVNAQAVCRAPEARALLLFDDAAYQLATNTPAAEGMDKPDPFTAGYDAGAHAVTASTLDEIEAAVTTWGFECGPLHETVTDYNRQLACEGTPVPGRQRYRIPLVDAPFRAIEVRPGITMTHGGLRVDAEARVVDAEGEPIAGLLAAGADAGGLNDGGYAGGLAPATVFGLQAAATASST